MDHLTRLNLIHRFVDGELSPDEVAQVHQMMAGDPAIRAQIEFEERLQVAVRDAMQTPTTAPADLADAVRASLLAEIGQAESKQETDAHPATANSRPPWYRALLSTNRASWGMVAATLLIVASAVLVGIFGPRIDELGRNDRDLVAEAALWASNEHGRCTVERDHTMGKTRWSDAETASKKLSSHLDRPLVVAPEAFEALGYDFLGAGPCRVPGGEPSGHLLFARPRSDSRGGALISLFAVRDSGQFDAGLPNGMEPGEWYRSDGGPQCSHQILRCTDSKLVYFMVCCDENDLESVATVLAGAINGR